MRPRPISWEYAGLVLLTVWLGLTTASLAQTNPASSPNVRPAHWGYCGSFVSEQVPNPAVDEQTHLNVHILADGTISQANVARSSGNAALDAAAIACVERAKHPVKSEGQSVEVDWQYDAVWRSNGLSYAMNSAAPFCLVSDIYPHAAIRKNEEGTVAVTYDLGVDGKVTKLQVIQSTGFPDLDQAFINCITNKNYPPASQSGRPISTDMNYKMVFKLTG